MRFVVDTGVLIARIPLPSNGDVAITALSIAELEFGVVSAARGGKALEVRARSTRLADIRRVYGEGLPFDGAAAHSYGEITDAVLAIGRNPRPRAVDLLIAATAHSHAAALVTTQPNEFRGLERLVDVVTAPGP